MIHFADDVLKTKLALKFAICVNTHISMKIQEDANTG